MKETHIYIARAYASNLTFAQKALDLAHPDTIISHAHQKKNKKQREEMLKWHYILNENRNGLSK